MACNSSTNSTSSKFNKSILLKRMRTGILYASQHAKNRSKNPKDVSGDCKVKIIHAKSKLLAIMCASLDKFTDFLIR